MHVITWTDKLSQPQKTLLPSSRIKDVLWLISILDKNGMAFSHTFID